MYFCYEDLIGNHKDKNDCEEYKMLISKGEEDKSNKRIDSGNLM